jgi:hypothetical protein
MEFNVAVKSFTTQATVAVLTTLQFVRNLQMGPVSKNDRPWQALPAKCSTLQFIWPRK